MKKLFMTFFLILFIWTNISFSYSFENTNNLETVNYLIKYTDSKISDVEQIIKKYNLENDKKLKIKIQELKNIKKILTLTKKTWKYKLYINKVIKELKDNNTSLKIYIKQTLEIQKEKVNNYKIIYSLKIKPIINKINEIVIKIAWKLMIKEKINNKDKQIINLLYQIKLKLDKLDNLTKINFNTKKELQNYIISTFNQIKFHFNQIKDIVRN